MSVDPLLSRLLSSSKTLDESTGAVLCCKTVYFAITRRSRPLIGSYEVTRKAISKNELGLDQGW